MTAMNGCPSIATIQARVAERFGVSVLDLRSERRDRRTVWYRHVAMYLCREMTMHPLLGIGRHFGDRDHRTVTSAVQRVADRISRDPVDAEIIGELRTELAHDMAGIRTARTSEEILARLGWLLERRKALEGDIEHIDQQIERVWGAIEGVPDNNLEGGQ